MNPDANHNSAQIDELFDEFIRSSKLKHTAQRMKIVKRAFAMRKHFSAEDLYHILRREKTDVSKATVYRTLKLLVEANFLDALEIGSRQAKFYEPVHGREHHDHMICLKCGQIVEFIDRTIESLQQKAASNSKFRVLSHSLKLFGLCATCNGR
ncbi:MAG: Fur family transcriptional regulator [Planctomycetota bacterium]